MKTNSLIRTGHTVAISSFIVGSLIFLLYFLYTDPRLILIGIGFLIVAGLANLWFLVKVFNLRSPDSKTKKRIQVAKLVILFNVPASIIYILVTLILLGSVRLTIVNSTDITLYDLKLKGCGEPRQIRKLDKGESKTVWIGIPHDCSLSLEYQSEGNHKREIVSPYLTHPMGEKLEYRINDSDATASEVEVN